MKTCVFLAKWMTCSNIWLTLLSPFFWDSLSSLRAKSIPLSIVQQSTQKRCVTQSVCMFSALIIIMYLWHSLAEVSFLQLLSYFSHKATMPSTCHLSQGINENLWKTMFLVCSHLGRAHFWYSSPKSHRQREAVLTLLCLGGRSLNVKAFLSKEESVHSSENILLLYDGFK